jgi:hypothetical protein
MKTILFLSVLFASSLTASAQGPANCSLDPYTPECSTSDNFCNLYPDADTCTHSQAFCHLNPDAPTCQ